MTESRY